MSKAKVQLNAAQREAVEYLEGPLLVLAGPGTGKTQLLSEKVAYILQNTDTNPENILCLTFTESGAANMRERLKGEIHADALKVNIGTYHAFGREILAQYQRYAESYTRVLDAAIDEVSQYKIVRELLEELPAYDILRGDSVKDVIAVISEAKAAGLTAADLAKVAEQNMADAEVIAGAISPLLQNVVPRKFRESYTNAYAPIYQVLQNYAQAAPILGRIERSIAGMTRDLAAAIEEAEASEKIKPLTQWKDDYFEKDENGNYRLRDRAANKKLQSVAAVMAQYQKYLEEHGLYDFDDMIEEAARVLATDEGFKLSLEERYQFIMLDEFQDTNPSQFAIVKRLTDYEKPLIMAVGDDDQAIYEFQGALSSNLTDFQEHYGAKVVTLTENYRSTQEILDFAREVIRQADDRFADKELKAQRPAPAQSQIRRVEFAGADAEYAFVAEEIAQLIRAGVPQSEIAVIAYKRKYFEPLLPYLKRFPEIKIAYERRDDLLEDPQIHQILTILGYVDDVAHERKPSEQLMEILSFPMFGLPALEVVKIAGKARKEHENLLEVLAEADDQEFAAAREMRATAKWLAELASMVYNEPLDVVINAVVAKMEARWGARGELRLTGVEAAEEKTGEKAREKVTDAARGGESGGTSGERADEAAADRVFGGEAYEKYVFYENLASLLGKVKQHCGEKALRVADLLEMVRDYEEAEMMLTGASPYRDADEAVQILTAHKAKGLEFQYVFIISADHTAWGKGKGNNNLLALPRNVAQIRHTGTTDSERLRVLYVALTRAKEGLVITNALNDFNGKAPDRLEYLQEFTDEAGKVCSPFLPTREVELRYEAGAPEVRERNTRSWLERYRPNSPAMREIYRERVHEWRMSASALTSFIDVVYAGPREFFKNYLMRAPQEPETEALAFGDLVHKTFEAVTTKGLTDEEAVGFYLEELAKKDLPAATLRQIRERGTEGLGKALAAFGTILRQGRAEVDLAPEKLVIEGVPVTGKIDHIIVDEAAQTLEVFDFKTGNYHAGKWQSHQTLFKYMLQLEFYRLLLGASAEFGKYRVERAHILFVTPDRDGEVHDKVYEYNAADEAKLVELMKAVYQLVTSLRFLEDEEILVKANPSKGLKDIRQFIELLVAKSREV